MDKKNLAKGMLAALLLAGSTVSAASFDSSKEASTFLAVAGCEGYNTAPSRGGYQAGPAGYDYTADDSNNPYARPGAPQGNPNGNMGGGYGYNPDRQSHMGGGYGYTTERPVSGGASYNSSDWQSSQSGANRRIGGGGNPQNYPTQNSPYDRSGSYNTNSRSNSADPYRNYGGGAAA
jgi:hypothetical protein